METAEEILSRHTGETGIYLTKGMIRGSDALEAMEEYAAQFKQPEVAIEKPIDIIETGKYIQPHSFESDGEALLFQSYLQLRDYVKGLENKRSEVGGTITINHDGYVEPGKIEVGGKVPEASLKRTAKEIQNQIFTGIGCQECGNRPPELTEIENILIKQHG